MNRKSRLTFRVGMVVIFYFLVFIKIKIQRIYCFTVILNLMARVRIKSIKNGPLQSKKQKHPPKNSYSSD